MTMQIEFQIVNMKPTRHVALPSGSLLVATFAVDVWPFKVFGANIRLQPSGDLFAFLPGKKAGGISISSEELKAAIQAEAVALYKERFSDGTRTQA